MTRCPSKNPHLTFVNCKILIPPQLPLSCGHNPALPPPLTCHHYATVHLLQLQWHRPSDRLPPLPQNHLTWTFNLQCIMLINACQYHAAPDHFPQQDGPLCPFSIYSQGSALVNPNKNKEGSYASSRNPNTHTNMNIPYIIMVIPNSKSPHQFQDTTVKCNLKPSMFALALLTEGSVDFK